MLYQRIGRLPLIFGLVLAGCWSVVVAFDILNVGGMRDWLTDNHPNYDHFFRLFFLESHPVEWMQWICLGLTGLLTAQLALRHEQVNQNHHSRFHLLFSLLFIILLMEDAGNVRHITTNILEPYFMPVPGFWELLIYALFASLPLYALARYGDHLWSFDRTTALFWAGVIAYAAAAIGSATRGFGDWYAVVGEALSEQFFGNRLDYPMYLLDALVEESIELIGALCFLAYFSARERWPSDDRGASSSVE